MHPTPRPQQRHGRSRSVAQSAISARVETMYVACVAFGLGVVGTAIGFTFGVAPYWHSANYAQYDFFFGSCVAIGALTGFIVGVANGARWYRSKETSPLTQRRMLAYLHRR